MVFILTIIAKELARDKCRYLAIRKRLLQRNPALNVCLSFDQGGDCCTTEKMERKD